MRTAGENTCLATVELLVAGTVSKRRRNSPYSSRNQDKTQALKLQQSLAHSEAQPSIPGIVYRRNEGEVEQRIHGVDKGSADPEWRGSKHYHALQQAVRISLKMQKRLLLGLTCCSSAVPSR